MSRQQKKRKERLIQLAEKFWIRVPDADEAGGYENSSVEDLAEYLYGDVHIDRWVAVTYHDDIHYLKTVPTRERAEERAIEYVTDDIFTESPVAVVDLDDPVEPCGKVYRVQRLIPIFEGS